ncbi:flavodoxin family protein [Thalassotalea sp. LPB0316]|uniref:flavodoxin family protein n=1 Tax=Thalassotalea sp. LPB0316 TaxID=2769490 RepID=UPI00186819A0|nr:flavodoxin family protein [Thalassotalea sp. LPB0316]QOL24572.1 flavodoxin family protein [Thalassotalea sp. LPB0316]
MIKTAIILGSARSDGNTAKLVERVASTLSADVFDLNTYRVLPFDYCGSADDDFRVLSSQLLDYHRLIFATPMYWYSASAQMKAFLDRLTDFLREEKDKGRQLRGKHGLLLATGASQAPAPCFEQMFTLTFKYLGMTDEGMLYCDCSNGFDNTTHNVIIDRYLAQLSTEMSVNKSACV